MNSLEPVGKRPTRVTGTVGVDVPKASSLVFDGGIEGTTRGFIISCRSRSITLSEPVLKYCYRLLNNVSEAQ
jgi:hypothetical protein